MSAARPVPRVLLQLLFCSLRACGPLGRRTCPADTGGAVITAEYSYPRELCWPTWATLAKRTGTRRVIAPLLCTYVLRIEPWLASSGVVPPTMVCVRVCVCVCVCATCRCSAGQDLGIASAAHDVTRRGRPGSREKLNWRQVVYRQPCGLASVVVATESRFHHRACVRSAQCKHHLQGGCCR